jgi:hypothetical protein
MIPHWCNLHNPFPLWYADVMSKENGVVMSKDGSWRRTAAQRDIDREEALVLSVQGYSNPEIVRLMSERRDYTLSIGMVTHDLTKARSMLADRFFERAEAALAMEMKRVEVLEKEAWHHFRRVINGSTMTKVVEVLSDDGESVETLKETLTSESPYALGWFNKILDIQKERRRLLKMYAPEHLTLIQMSKVEEVKVKAYASFNPGEDWPDAPQKMIPGEIVDGD